MNKNSRLYRGLRAFKHAFLEDVNTSQPIQPPKTTTNNNVVKNEPITNDLLTITENPKTVEDLKSEHCTGCSACFNLCPVQAITMQYDKEGFLAPVIDHEKCINCGLCINKCPVVNPNYNNFDNPKCYAVMAKDDIRMKSSSGGVFSLLANYVFSKGGYVVGASFNENFNVKHIIINSSKEMYKLRGSKYVQSDVSSIYQDIKKLLDDGKLVLFSGCPCQVAGIKTFFDKKYDNLITMDIVCHGVPSPKAFSMYLNETCNLHDIKEFKFRTKIAGYNCLNLEIIDKNNQSQLRTIDIDLYEKCFHNSIMLRKSCYNCHFCELPRQGDLTVGDFWGISQFNKDFNDGKGTSLTFINTSKGTEIFDIISKNTILNTEVPIEYALRNNRFNSKIKYNSQKRRYFFELLQDNSFIKSAKYSINDKYDVAIMGVWSGCNYGSIATYYALHQLIKGFGLSILMIDKPLISENDPEQSMTHSRRFANEHYQISRRYKLNELGTLNNHVDTFIMGCDQVWNRGISKHFGFSYYFNFVDSSKKKISYASSFGHSKDFSSINDRVTISEYLSRFDDISVREADGVTICKDVYNVEATQVLDPVFVADKSIFEELTYKSIANNRPDKDEKYIVTYILDPTDEKKEAIKWVSSKLNLKVINILDGLPWTFSKNSEKMADMGEIPENVQIEDWLYYIKNSEFLITDSCHGISFGIIFERDFIGIANSHRGLSRFESLLNTFKLTDRYVTNPSKIINNDNLLKHIDYTKVNQILEIEKKRSKDWLKNALFKPKKLKTNCAYAVYDERLEENKNV